MVDELTRTNPFPGLRSFEPDEDHLFFGREARIDELLTRLRRSRFLSVVGTSGSGKSSLIRSGLIPSLYSGVMASAGSSWRVALFRPGEDPIGNLAGALNSPEVLGSEEEPDETKRALLEVTLRRSAMGLVECIRQARIPEHENVLVVVDQFEELFRFKHSIRLHDSRDEAVAFVKLLLAAAHNERPPVYVVITMRSDFIGNCTEFEGLTEAINDGQYLVPRMTRDERRSAIVGPVAVGGAEITPRLVLRLLNDVGDDPDQLPILQHALMRTWDYWETHHTADEALDLRHYEAIGTMREALSQHAEEAYRELDSSRARAIAEKMFKALTDRGSDARGVRNPRPLDEICSLADTDGAEVGAVIDVFRKPGRCFLMPPAGAALHGTSIIDISHESLMRIWGRLIQWVDEEARSAQVYLRISKAAGQYQQGKAGLFRDPELQLALNWREEAQPNAVWAERYDVAFERAMLFLDHSERQRAQEQEEKERQRKRQLQWARRLAVILGSAALVTLAFGLYALTLKIQAEENFQEALRQKEIAEEQRQEADHQRVLADEQRENAEQARVVADQQRDLADEQRVIAEDQRSKAERERARAEAQEKEALRRKQQAEEARELEEAARTEAEQQRSRALHQKERAEISEAQAQRLRALAIARELAVKTSQLLGEDQRELAALLARQAYRLHLDNGGKPFDPDLFSALYSTLARLAPQEIKVLRYHTDAVRCVAASPTSSIVATGGDDGAVYLVDLKRLDAAPVRLEAPVSEVRSLAWNEQGTQLAVGTFDGAIRLWNDPYHAAGKEPTAELHEHTSPVNALAYQPAGNTLASGDLHGVIRLFKLAKLPSSIILQDKNSGRIEALVFTSSDTLLVGTHKGLLQWELVDTKLPTARFAEDHRIMSLATHGSSVVAGTEEGPILFWPSGVTESYSFLPGHLSSVRAVAFSSSGDRLASASMDSSVRIWNLEQPESEPVELSAHTGWVWAVAYAKDEGTVISGGADRTVRLWPTSTKPLADAICEHASRNLTKDEWSDFLPEDFTWEATCSSQE